MPLGTMLSCKGNINKASIIYTPRTIHSSAGKKKHTKSFELNSQEFVGKGPCSKKSFSAQDQRKQSRTLFLCYPPDNC